MGKSVLNNGQIVDEERGKRTAVFVRFQSFIYNSPSVDFLSRGTTEGLWLYKF